jgi:cytochrome c6
VIKKQYVSKALLALLPMLGVAGAGEAADINKGARFYITYCASCHGNAGVPVMPGSPNFQRGEKLLQADFALLASIRRGKAAMPAYMGILRDQEIMDVIAYLRTLQR